MPKVCLECYEVYRDGSLIERDYGDDIKYQICPKTSCCGNVVEIDELLLPTIIILNQKGYYTKYCCSGHIYENYPNAYIYFEEDVVLPNTPKGYTLEDDNIIRKCFNDNVDNDSLGKSEYEIFSEICKSSVDLLKWANKLPDICEYE